MTRAASTGADGEYTDHLKDSLRFRAMWPEDRR